MRIETQLFEKENTCVNIQQSESRFFLWARLGVRFSLRSTIESPLFLVLRAVEFLVLGFTGYAARQRHGGTLALIHRRGPWCALAAARTLRFGQSNDGGGKDDIAHSFAMRRGAVDPNRIASARNHFQP